MGVLEQKVSTRNLGLISAEKQLLDSYMTVNQTDIYNCETCNNCGSGDCNDCCASVDD